MNIEEQENLSRNIFGDMLRKLSILDSFTTLSGKEKHNIILTSIAHLLASYLASVLVNPNDFDGVMKDMTQHSKRLMLEIRSRLLEKSLIN